MTRFVRSILRVASVLFFLYFFLVAIELLGSSFKMLGKDFVDLLFTTTANPFVGLFVGIFATVLVQSSSVTTSIIVGLVSGGVLSVGSAVPMVMGANIGTTVTNLLVSFGHVTKRDEFERAFSGSVIHDFFNLLTVAILLPLELLTGYLAKAAGYFSHGLYGMAGLTYDGPLKAFVKPLAKGIQTTIVDLLPFSKGIAGTAVVVVSVLMIFSALFFLVKLLRTLMMNRVVGILSQTLAKASLVTLLIGVFITVLVQSSSITTSLLVPLLGGGIIDLEVAFPIVLGANIGTTVTALLAAMAGTEAGLTIALVHLLFNVTGILMIYPFRPIRKIPLAMARWMGRRVHQKRRAAVIFVLLTFFVVPFGIIFLSRLWN